MASTRKRPSSRSQRILARVKRPPVLVGSGFAVVAAAIVANALLLQSAPHPAPFFTTRAVESPRAAPDPLVRSIQSALSHAGYYTGPVDGVAGPQTTSAIGAFERDSGRLVTGQADAELLAALQSRRTAAVTPSSPAAPAAPARPGVNAVVPADPKIAAVQDALAKAAYGPLLADGVLGAQTRDAIERFQRDHGLPPTGEISDTLILELRAAGALAGD